MSTMINCAYRIHARVMAHGTDRFALFIAGAKPPSYDIVGNSIMRSRTAHIQVEQPLAAKFEFVHKLFRNHAHGCDKFGRYRPAEQRRNRIADLPEAMPLGRMQP